MICEFLNNKLRYRDVEYKSYAYVDILGDDTTAYLEIIITDPKYRNTGLGRNLLEFIISDLNKKGVTLIKLDVQPASTEIGLDKNQLHDWYKRFGFVEGNNGCMWLELTDGN